MKRIVLLFLTVVCVITGKSQTNVNADCINAIPLCSTPSFTFFATSGVGAVIDFSTNSSVSNPSANPQPPNSGCLLSGELNPQWLLLTVGNAGLLEFVFGAGNSANPQAGFYDWSMWPYSPATCNGIFNNTLPPVRCNWNGSGSGGTGIASATNITAVGGNSSNFQAPLQVNACQQFIICISNYSGVNTLVSFLSLGTASLSCNPNCNPNYSTCAGGNATVVPVNFASLTNPTFSMQPGAVSSATGSFVVTPSVTTNYTTYITGLNSVNAVQTITSVSTVSVFAQPSAIPKLTQSNCTNSLTTLNIGLSFTPSATSYSVLWSPQPSGISSVTQTSVTAYQAAGVYNATISTAAGCTASTVFTVSPLPSVPQINLAPSVTNFSLTCYNPAITFTALDAANSYTWNNGLIASQNGQFASFTYSDQGTWTITAVDPTSGCATTKVLTIAVNTLAPTATLTPMFQNINCNIASIQNVSIVTSPTVNSQIAIVTALGGTFTSNSYSTAYLPGSPGSHTCYALNSTNGCSTALVFTVASNFGFPSFSLSSPQNYTLGCGTKSVATININNASATNSLQVPTGGAVSYTLLAPGASTAAPTGSLGASSSYSVNVPGTWTVVVKDNISFCETRLPVSILSNTASPNLQALVPQQILDCNTTKIKLLGLSETQNIAYTWLLPGGALTQPGDSISVNVNFGVRTQSLIGNYTLVVTDNSSTCKSSSVIPMFQNLYQPNVIITNGGVSALSCKTKTVTLTNQSNTGIPAGTGFVSNNPVVGNLWQGPTPMEEMMLSTTYVGNIVGVYTLTAKDLNNGCTRTGTISIGSNSLIPLINFSVNPVLDCATGQAIITPAVNYSVDGKMSYTIVPPPGGTVNPLTNATASFVTLNLGQHRLNVLNTDNGCSSSTLFNVVQGSLTAAFEADVAGGFSPLPVTFINTSSTSSSNLTNPKPNQSIASIWQFGNGTFSVALSPTVAISTTYFAPGAYTVTMHAKSGLCQDSASYVIKVDNPSSLEVPNIFTPNGDGSNDVFFLHAAGMAKVEMEITDRWGHLVYQIIGNEGNISWDGIRENGKAAVDGVYFYVLKAVGRDGVKYEKTGTITIMR